MASSPATPTLAEFEESLFDLDFTRLAELPLPVLQSIEGLPELPADYPIRRPEDTNPQLRCLLDAIREGDAAAAMRLVRERCEEDSARPRELGYILIEAIKSYSGDNTVVLELLSHDTPITNDVIREAIRAKSVSLLSVLLDFGWDLNQQLGWWEPPPLSLCVDDRELLEWFLANGADPNRRCAIDMTPLSTAVQAAPWDILQLMLSSGGSFERGQLLQHAARRKDDCIKVLQLILDHGAPINNVEFQDDLDSYYQQRALGLGTALHGTACQGKIDVITFLTDRGANPLIRDSWGRLPGEAAEAHGHYAAASTLRTLEEAAEPPTEQFTAGRRMQDTWSCPHASTPPETTNATRTVARL